MSESSSQRRLLLNTETWMLFSTRRGKMTFVAFAVGVVFVLLTAAAAACIPWRGEVQVTSQDRGDSTTVHGGDGEGGTGSGMVWCEDSGDSAVDQPYTSVDANNDDTLTVEVVDTVSGCDSDALQGSEYTISWSNEGFTDDDPNTDEWRYQDRADDCMDTLTNIPDYTWSETLTITNGTGSQDVDLAEATPTDSDSNKVAGGLCITEDAATGQDGNMVPVSVFSS